MIVASEVGKRFERDDREIAALDRLSFSIADGEFVAIVGPSGCGKTTLLRMIAGIVSPSEGSISIGGRRVTGPSVDVGIVFQTPVLFPWRTIVDNVLVPADVRGERGRYREKAVAFLRTAGLGGFEHAYPWEMSGGMQQRAALCRALVYDPPVLLLDEPFGALDAMTREAMNAELTRLWEQSHSAVVLITHSIAEAVFLADRILVLSSRPGRIVADVRIGLPRSRSLDMMGSPEFGELTRTVRRLLQEHHALVAR